MQLRSVQPLLLTARGCPLAFDVMDNDNPDAGIIGRATYQRWERSRGIIWYQATIVINGRNYTAELSVSAKKKL